MRSTILYEQMSVYTTCIYFSLSLSTEGWELLAKENSNTIYHRMYKDSGLYQYKVIGRYHDITAKDYRDVQVIYMPNVHACVMVS